jgi:Fe-S cluster assembly protein SufD
MTAFLAERRRVAAERSAALPVPTIRDEHWRYTNLRGIDFTAYAPTPSPVVLEAGSLPAGVLFMDLERAAAEHPELIERHLGAIVGTDEKFAAENAALWTDGVLVYVPRGVEVDDPLQARFTIGREGAAQQWRVLVIAEEGSRFTFMEEHAEGAPGYANGVAELHVGAAAHVEYVSFQHRHLDTLHFAYHRAEVDRDAELDWVAVALGSKTGKSRMESRLIGPGSRSKLTGAYVLDGTQHVDLDTTQEHDAPHATSDLFFKGVLSQDARSVWRGVIRVAEGAQKTDAYQENRNLVLSSRAHADSIPGLEIKANDVRCTHGATIGRVDPEELYYLMSRGLDRAAAERLIVEGFFVDAFQRISSAPLRERVQQTLLAKLP